MASYEVAHATLPGDAFPVYQVLRTDLVPAPGSRRKPPPIACRYYQATVDAQTGDLLVKRIGKLSDVKAEPHVRHVRKLANHPGLWCSCGYTDTCPHRRVWHAMGMGGGNVSS